MQPRTRVRGRSLSHLIRIIDESRGAASRSARSPRRSTPPAHGAFLFNLFGSLAEYERALIKERVAAGLAAARRRGRKGGRPPAIDPEKVEQIIAALEGGASKASVCRTFQVPRSTLIDTLERVGWTGAGAGAQKVKRVATPKKAA